jgi:nucleoside-diphosphate-sugar epimerase
MKILLTGANGFLGRCIYTKIVAEGVEIFQTSRNGFNNTIACDLTSKIAVKMLLENITPDVIIHCAAFVPKISSDYQNNKMTSINSIMLKNILKFSISKIIYISSMTVYGYSGKQIRLESDLLQPESAYAKSKFDGENLLKYDGRDSLIIRIPGLFGKERSSGIVSNTLKALINKCTDITLPNKPILWAAMSVEDASTSIVKLLLNADFKGYTPINIGYNDIYSIRRFVELCEEIFRVIYVKNYRR